MSLFQKKFANEMNWKNSGVNVTQSVAVLTNIEINGPKLIHRWGYEWL